MGRTAGRNLSPPTWKYLVRVFPDRETLVSGDLPGPLQVCSGWQPERRCCIPPHEVWTGACAAPASWTAPLLRAALGCWAGVLEWALALSTVGPGRAWWSWEGASAAQPPDERSEVSRVRLLIARTHRLCPQNAGSCFVVLLLLILRVPSSVVEAAFTTPRDHWRVEPQFCALLASISHAAPQGSGPGRLAGGGPESAVLACRLPVPDRLVVFWPACSQTKASGVARALGFFQGRASVWDFHAPPPCRWSSRLMSLGQYI